jgi:uncharacterized phosphosugar-binding protein
MSRFLYAEAVRKIIDHLETSQSDNIEKAAQLIVDALKNKGVVYCSEIGHSNQNDFLNRAGGLAAIQAFTYSFAANAPTPSSFAEERAADPDQDLKAVRLAVEVSAMRKGDVLVLGSVSGKNRAPIEVAMACQAKGIKVVAFTSLTYTAQVQSLHPSGKKLCDVADVVIDNGAPYGDAAVAIPGMENNALPVSGSSSIIGGWMIFERVMTLMAASGDPATVFMSVNREGGMEKYQADVAKYQERGY